MPNAKALSLALLITTACYGTTAVGIPCLATPAPLKLYLSSAYSNGCDVSELNYRFLEFGKLTPNPGGGYSFNSEGGTITPDNLFVLPDNIPGSPGVSFQSDAFESDFSGAPELYFLSYIVDAPPIIGDSISVGGEASTSSFVSAPFTFQQTAPSVDVTKYLCPDDLFVRLVNGPEPAANRCAGGPGPQTEAAVVLMANLQRRFDSVIFSQGVPLVANHLLIELSGDLRGSGFTGVSSTPILTAIPEPFSAGLTLAGLGMIAGLLQAIRRR